MHGRSARMLLVGLLAIGLQAGVARATPVATSPSQRLDATAQARQLLPATLALLQAIEQAANEHGRALTVEEIRIAQRLGVSDPARVRVLVTPILPSWMAPELMANGLPANAATGPAPTRLGAAGERRYGVAGITAGHGILIGLRNAGDPRVLAHELAHVAQFERLGVRGFALRYLTELLQVGYFNAPLEREADAAMHRVLGIPQTSTAAANPFCRTQACRP